MKVKVIDIKRYYKWIGIFVTCIMCILSFQILILDTKDMVAKANGIEKRKNFVQADTKKYMSDNLLILFINKTIPIMEVNYEKEYGKSHYKEIMKLALGKLVNFDYEDPKTLFKAEISMLKEADDDMAEMDDYYLLNNESKSTMDFVQKLPDIKEDVEIKDHQNEAIESSNMKEVNHKGVNNQSNKALESIQIVSSSIKMPNKVKLDINKPTIFIYHTHATESYMPESVGNFHSLNRKYTVRAVGDALTKELTSRGYKVIHNDTLHDYPSYQRSYVRSLETLRANLKKNTSLKIIFDIHRDAAPKNDTAREKSYVIIDGKKVAKFSIVVGTENENAEKLLVLAEYIKAKCDEYYPGLAKKTITKPYKFNEFNSDYYALIEVGNTANYIEEAVRTTKYLAEILDRVIKDIKE
ncbi:stage II sporulation protein P [Crassaminicella thermophila]|uniref:stage II sporulation protein P n=1 Tax=Crassaminicella thermophila TaxID=2599308 RepID=UPI001E4F9C6F|nr:stage II sporulation protein P [Crassaminicella thermophila]